MSLVKTFEMVNPLEEDTKELLVLDTKDIMENAIVQTVKNVLNIGNAWLYHEFIKERFNERPKSISEMIKKETLPLFREPQMKVLSKDKEKVKSKVKRKGQLRKMMDFVCSFVYRMPDLRGKPCRLLEARKPAMVTDFGEDGKTKTRVNV